MVHMWASVKPSSRYWFGTIKHVQCAGVRVYMLLSQSCSLGIKLIMQAYLFFCIHVPVLSAMLRRWCAMLAGPGE